MSNEFSSFNGHHYAPGHEPTLAERLLALLALLAPYSGLIIGISLLLIFWVVARWALRKQKADRVTKAKQDAAERELSPVAKARIAQRQRLKAAFDERQDAAAKVRADLRERHFGDATS